ncbi:MAG: S41 family peptidase [Fimbriimonadaceae bacterium]|nr:S41 family peptidase [Fimbriimonadaceae bacterium]
MASMLSYLALIVPGTVASPGPEPLARFGDGSVVAQEPAPNPTPVVAEKITAQTELTVDAMAKDREVLFDALETLHASLTRYQSAGQWEAAKRALARAQAKPMSLQANYVAISRLLGSIRCGHTYANYYNQTDAVQAALFDRADKLPLTFRRIEDKWLVERAVDIPRGSELVAINDRRMGVITRDLLPYVKADGSNDGKRLYDLQLTGLGQFEAWDVLQPMIFPPRDGLYVVKFRRPGKSVLESIAVLPITRAARRERLKLIEPEPWQVSVTPDKIGVLTMRSWTTWNFKFKWDAFLRDAFTRFRQETPQNLVIDLRGNEGGADDVIRALALAIVPRPIEYQEPEVSVRFETVPERLRPHLSSWNPIWDWRPQIARREAGRFYRVRAPKVTVGPGDQTYRGRVWVLMDAGNSSATFGFARLVREFQLGTLVGTTTGGNQRGTSGGQFFVLTLPNSRITADIPLLTRDTPPGAPDRGLDPDVPVRTTVADYQAGVDAEMRAIRERIARINAGQIDRN